MSRKIIGISMVRNEDLFVERAIKNVSNFCDKIIILDNQSSDCTWDKITDLCDKYSHIEAHKIRSFSHSHAYVSSYAGTDSWLFGIDGDEIYDPTRLASFRNDLISGMYDSDWVILGNVVHCIDIDWSRNKARGYQAPPSKSMTKLYNFNAIESWPGQFERFHNNNMTFRDGYNKTHRRKLYFEHSWDQSPFRCLHVCFMRRSSDAPLSESPRPLPGETPLPLRIADLLGLGRLFGPLIQRRQSNYKRYRYARGPLIEFDVSSFQ